jgi:hypothetical protein
LVAALFPGWSLAQEPPPTLKELRREISLPKIINPFAQTVDAELRVAANQQWVVVSVSGNQAVSLAEDRLKLYDQIRVVTLLKGSRRVERAYTFDSRFSYRITTSLTQDRETVWDLVAVPR